MTRPGALVLLVLLCACGGGREAGTAPVSDSVYVEVMARLVLLDSASSPRPDLTEAAADSARDHVLETWGVRADQLLEYARTRGTRPAHMEAIWRRVQQLADSLGAAGWRPTGARADSSGT